jgi:PAS domain S-box-containing protein
MKNNTRKSGIGFVGNIPWGTHFFLLYKTKEDLMEILVPYFKAGLENNEMCIWLIPESLSIKEAKEALRKAIPGFGDYFKKGQIEFLSYADWFLRNDTFDSMRIFDFWAERLNQALSSGYEGLRLTEDICWQKKLWDNLIDSEERLDSAIGKYSIIALCTYSLEICSPVDIVEIAANHDFALVKKKGKWKKIDSFGQKDGVKLKRVEDSLKTKEQHLNDLLSSIQDGFFELDREWRFTYINKRAANNENFEPEELIGENIWKKFFYMAGSKFEEAYRRVMHTRVPAQFEIKSKIRNQWYEISVYPSTTGISVFWRDITIRKQVENALNGSHEEIQIQSEELQASYEELQVHSEELRVQAEELQEAYQALSESEEKYRNIVETANEGIWIVDLEARTTFVNKKMADMLGYTQEEMSGRSRQDFTDKKGREISKQSMEKRLQGIDESYEFKLIRKDGTPLWTLVNSKSLFNKNGRLAGFMSMLTDITQRKEAEVRLEETLDNLEKLVKERTAELEKAYSSLKESEKGLSEAQRMAHIGNWNWNHVTGEVYWSEEMYRIFGLDLQEHITYNRFLSCIHPDDKDYISNSATEAFNGKIYAAEYRVIRPDGEERTVYSEREVIFNEGNNPVGIRGTVQDITERKRAEEKRNQLLQDIDEQRARLQAIIDSLPVGLWIADATGKMVFSNNVASKIWIGTAHHPKDINEYDTYKVWWSETGESVASEDMPLARAVRGETHTEDVIDFERFDGMLGTQLVSSAPIKLSDGTIIGGVTIFQDITERKQAEEALHKAYEEIQAQTEELQTANEQLQAQADELDEANKALLDSEAKFKAYLENSAVIAWMKDEEGHHTFLSSNYEKRFGVRFEDWRGKTDFELWPWETAKKFSESDLAVLKSRKHVEVIEEIKNPDGSASWWLNNKFPFVDSSGKKYVGSLSVDVTKLKRVEEALRKSEERFRLALKNSPIIMFTQDRELKYTWVYNPSPGFKIKDILGKSDYEIYQPEDAETFATIKQQVFTSGIGRRDEVVTHRHASDGGNLVHEMSTEPLRDASGSIVGVICVALDITERKRAEETLARYETARQKELHHRIKNNLQVISSLLDLAADKFIDKKSIESTEVLEAFKESQNRVLSIAFIHKELHEGGGLDTLNFSLYIERLAKNVFQTYQLGDMDISLNLDLEENILFNMDIAIPLGIIVNELVSNSFKYAFAGRDKGVIQVKLFSEGIKSEPNNNKESLQEGTGYTLIVADDGIGIPEDINLENSDTLGMQLVNILVNQLDGEIEIKRGHGTEFIIRFSNIEE